MRSLQPQQPVFEGGILLTQEKSTGATLFYHHTELPNWIHCKPAGREEAPILRGLAYPCGYSPVVVSLLRKRRTSRSLVDRLILTREGKPGSLRGRWFCNCLVTVSLVVADYGLFGNLWLHVTART